MSNNLLYKLLMGFHCSVEERIFYEKVEFLSFPELFTCNRYWRFDFHFDLCERYVSMQYAVLENSGQLSVLPWAKAKPPTAEDLGLTLEEDALPTVLINDGRVLRNNLRLCGRDEVWLQKILKQEHCTTKEVFLLTVDENGKTLCIPKEADP